MAHLGGLRQLPRTAVLVVSLGACLQPVVHPTRIEPGLELTFGTSIHLALDSVGNHEQTLRRGIGYAVGLAISARDTLRDGVASRFAFGAGTTGLYGGGYFELPRSIFGDWDAGLGTTVFFDGLNAVMPYVQAGFNWTETVAPFVSLGTYLMQEDVGRRVRPALTFGASLHAPFGRRKSTAGVLYSTILFNASDHQGASCPLECGSDPYLDGTFLILGFGSSIRLNLPGTGGPPGYSRPNPARR